MRDISNNFYNLDIYGKSSKRPYNPKGKMFGYHVLGFGGFTSGGGFLPTQRGIFAHGYDYTLASDSSSYYGVSNLVNSSGVVSSDVSAVMSVVAQGAAAGFGGDKGIFAFGYDGGSQAVTSRSNLVNNVGTVASDVTGVGTARLELGAATFGGDKAIFALGTAASGQTGISNLVSNIGVVASDTSAVSTARQAPQETELGEVGVGGIAAFFGGYSLSAGGPVTKKNIISNVGVVASDANTSNFTAKAQGAGCRFGSTGQGIVGYGDNGGKSNILSATGSASSEVNQVANGGIGKAACSYGGDKGIFCYGTGSGHDRANARNLVSNSGVIAASASGAGTVRSQVAACDYSTIAN